MQCKDELLQCTALLHVARLRHASIVWFLLRVEMMELCQFLTYYSASGLERQVEGRIVASKWGDWTQPNRPICLLLFFLFQNLAHVVTQRGRDVGTLERVADGGGEQAERAARIVAHTGKAQAVTAPRLRLHLKRVGDLDLAALAGGSLLDQRENIRSDDVVDGDAKIGRRLFERWLLDKMCYLQHIVSQLLYASNAIGGDSFRGQRDEAEHGAIVPLMDLHHTRQAGRIGRNQVIAQDDNKWLIAHHILCAENGMPQTKRLTLAHRDIGRIYCTRRRSSSSLRFPLRSRTCSSSGNASK